MREVNIGAASEFADPGRKHRKTPACNAAITVRELLQHLHHSRDEFVEAPGIRGQVMLVFTLPSYPYVFKVIRDTFGPGKDTDRATVRSKFTMVKHVDRVGRLADTLEFVDLALPRERFSAQLLEPMQVEDRDLASTQTRATRITGMLPYFVMMAVLYGALNAALDTTAGCIPRVLGLTLLVALLILRRLRQLLIVLAAWIMQGVIIQYIVAPLAQRLLAPPDVRQHIWDGRQRQRTARRPEPRHHGLATTAERNALLQQAGGGDSGLEDVRRGAEAGFGNVARRGAVTPTGCGARWTRPASGLPDVSAPPTTRCREPSTTS